MPTASGPTTTRPGRPRVGCVAFVDGDAYAPVHGPVLRSRSRRCSPTGPGSRARAPSSTSAAGPACSPRSWSAATARPHVDRGRPVARLRRRCPRARARRRGPAGRRRAAPLRRRLGRRRARPARRPLHGRPGRAAWPRWRGSPGPAAWSPPASGTTPARRGPLSLFWSAVRSQGDPVERRVPARRGPRGRTSQSCSVWPAARDVRGRPDRRDGRVPVVRGLVGAVHDGASARPATTSRLADERGPRAVGGRVPLPAARAAVRAHRLRLGRRAQSSA